MDILEDKLTVDEKLILFNTIKRAVKSISKHSTGYHYDFMMVRGAKFQALDKVLCLLAEELNKDCLTKEVFCKQEQVNGEYGISDADTIQSVITGYVAS